MGKPIRDLIWQGLRKRRPLSRVIADVFSFHGGVPEDAVPWIARAYQVGEDDVRRAIAESEAAARRPCQVLLCRGKACAAANGRRIERAVCERLGVPPGRATADGRFDVKAIDCLGNCEYAPSIVVGDELLDRTTPEEALRAIDRAKPETA